MSEVRIMPAERWHVLELAARIRPEDYAEIQQAGYKSALHALEVSVQSSAGVWAVLFDGKVAVVYGAVQLEQGAGAWALTSTVVDEHRLTFVRTSRRALKALLADCGRLEAFVGARYQGALDWLEVLGFQLGPEQLHPVTGAPFRAATIGGP